MGEIGLCQPDIRVQRPKDGRGCRMLVDADDIGESAGFKPRNGIQVPRLPRRVPGEGKVLLSDLVKGGSGKKSGAGAIG